MLLALELSLFLAGRSSPKQSSWPSLPELALSPLAAVPLAAEALAEAAALEALADAEELEEPHAVSAPAPSAIEKASTSARADRFILFMFRSLWVRCVFYVVTIISKEALTTLNPHRSYMPCTSA